MREIIGALHGLTGQDFDDAELFSMSLSEDPRRQVLQRRIYAATGAGDGRRGGRRTGGLSPTMPRIRRSI